MTQRAGRNGLETAPPTQTAWVFDLDNTLYPAGASLFAQIDRKMGAFLAELFDVDLSAARRLQKRYFLKYGTTLRGLMERHGVDPHAFLDKVHDIDLSTIAADPALDAALDGLAGRKFVFTNASAGHAERVLRRLGVERHFDGLYDIVAADFEPKPCPATYTRFIERHEVAPAQAVMIEDMARNLAPAAEIGMTTVWLRTSYEWANVDHDPAAVHHEIDDLVAYLKAASGGEALGR